MINNSNTENQLENTVEERWFELYNGQSIKVPNGDSLIRRFGPEESGICFIINDDNKNVKWDNCFDEHGNIITKMKAIFGEFWISKAGTSCFRPSEKGKYMFIMYDDIKVYDEYSVVIKPSYIKKTKSKVFACYINCNTKFLQDVFKSNNKEKNMYGFK